MEKNRGETSTGRVGKQHLQKSVSMCHSIPRRSVELSRPEHFRCLMGYVVDLTLILQAVFQVSLENGHEITSDRVNDIIYEFHSSAKKRRIHKEIWVFDRCLSLKDNVADKIESLIKENEV